MINNKEHEEVIQLLLNALAKVKAFQHNNKVKPRTPLAQANDLKKQYRKMIQKKLLNDTN